MLSARKITFELAAQRTAQNGVASESLPPSSHHQADKSVSRPADPEIDIAAIRSQELLAQIIAGRLRADASILGAGLLGGASNTAITVWAVFGLICFAFFIYAFSAYSISVNTSFSIWTRRALLLSGSFCFLTRSFLLARKMYRRAYWMFIISISFTAVCVVLHGVALFFDNILNVEQFKIFICESASDASCSGYKILIAKIFSAGFIFFVLWGVPLLFIYSAFELSEGKFSSATDVIRASVAVAAAGCVSQAIGFAAATFFFWAALSLIISVLVTSFYIYLYKRKKDIRARAHEKVRIDKEKYDLEWDKNKGSMSSQIKALDEVIKKWETSMCRVMNKTRGFSTKVDAELIANYDLNPMLETGIDEQEKAIRGLTMETAQLVYETMITENTEKPVQVIDDLVVLFGQAAVLNGHFQDCVQKWSSEIVVPDPDKKPVKVKRNARAIQKMFRSYGGKANRLIDLVRSSISFDTLEALTEVFVKIQADPRVAIFQVKNRFRPGYDSRDSAGYRNVALSLVVVDDETMRLGVEAHLCELQLGLKYLDNIKNKEGGGHKKYVEWRDLLAE